MTEPAAALSAIPQLPLADPSAPGPYRPVLATYGSGTDARRREFGPAATWRTPTIDASGALVPLAAPGDAMSSWYWGFDHTALPLNARLWYPADAPGRRPVILIAHGNHDAGDFSDPGYAYLGEHLASRGMIAASIDMNFLNGGPMGDYAGQEMDVRAWLLLRHLEQLGTWDETPGHPLAGRVDRGLVALVGHSRGGEAAAVAAMLQSTETLSLRGLPPVPRGFGIRAVVAFAPSDGMYTGPATPVVLRDVDYLVMQGAHDGDLPGFDGLRTYHRAVFEDGGPHLKAAVYTLRANHGRFNTIWNDGDAGSLASWMLDRGAVLSPAEQERLAKTMVTAFLARSFDGATEWDALFREPRAARAWLPDDIVQTHWESAGRVALDTFDVGGIAAVRERAAGFDEVRFTEPLLRDGTSIRDRGVLLRWTAPARLTTAVEPGDAAAVDASGSLVLSLVPDFGSTAAPDVGVEIRLVDGRTARVALAAVAPVRPLLTAQIWKHPWLGDRYLPTEKHDIRAEQFLQTYALPFATFQGDAGGFEAGQLASVSVTFDGRGAVVLDDLAVEPGLTPGVVGR